MHYQKNTVAYDNLCGCEFQEAFKPKNQAGFFQKTVRMNEAPTGSHRRFYCLIHL